MFHSVLVDGLEDKKQGSVIQSHIDKTYGQRGQENMPTLLLSQRKFSAFDATTLGLRHQSNKIETDTLVKV